MKSIDIIGENHFETWTQRRVACRGVVVQGERVLVSYEEQRDQYGIPGGGMEGQESLESCCRREIAEETGVLVSVENPYLIVNEFYEEWKFETHFFACKAVDETERQLTEREQEVGLVPKWIDLKEALAIFSRHQEYAQADEEKRGIYLREYIALREFIKIHRKY